MRKSKSVWVVVLCVLIIGCNSEKKSSPKDIRLEGSFTSASDTILTKPSAVVIGKNRVFVKCPAGFVFMYSEFNGKSDTGAYLDLQCGKDIYCGYTFCVDKNGVEK